MHTWTKDLHHLVAACERASLAFCDAHAAHSVADMQLRAASATRLRAQRTQQALLFQLWEHCQCQPPHVFIAPPQQEKIAMLFRIWLGKG